MAEGLWPLQLLLPTEVQACEPRERTHQTTLTSPVACYWV